MFFIDYIFNDKNKKYYPDYYLPDYILIVEIKSNYTYECEKDQNEAKNILSSLIIKLRADNRCSNSDFIRTDSYLRIPQDYVNSRVYKNTVNNTTNSTKSTVYGYPQGAAKVVGHVTQNKSKITFISRKTQLPKKTKLKALEARIVQGNIQVELPISEDLEEVVDTVDDDYANMYGAY